ncbi:HlyD family secretion protein [Aestuariispira ectoiniformans]|uniref:HlyD family secretion protein n=1 Tax=Aestuariispira ectoiniformans TaxID=2775080 RepID=UPI00223B77F1|nr:HlyD family secretion protein [Aestuariispira ectoiniformans]
MKKLYAAAAVVLLGAGAYFAHDAMEGAESVEAFVNIEVVEYKANAVGAWEPSKRLVSDEEFQAGDIFGKIVVPESDPGVLGLKTRMLEVKNQIADARNQLKSIDNEKKLNTSHIKHYRDKYDQSVEISSKVAKLENELIRVQTERKRILLNRQKDDYNRSRSLNVKKIISDSVLQDDETNYLASVQEVKALNIQSKINDWNRRAMEQGLQYEESQVFNYYLSRVNEYVERNRYLNNSIISTNNDIKTAEELYHAYETLYGQVANLQFTASGRERVWEIHSYGQAVTEGGELLFTTLKCDNVWVEAYIYQKHVDEFSVGRKVHVRFKGADEAVTGTVRAIRQNVDRVQIGSPMPIPPIDLVRRQLPVKIASLLVDIDSNDWLRQQAFCGAGVTAIVTSDS